MSESKHDCWHPSAYYNEENDNFYCNNCKAGMGTAYYIAQTQLTDLQTKLEKAREALERLHSDCLASDFNEHWDSYQLAAKTLDEVK